MEFVVIGAGAVGLLTACLLKEAGNEVQLITRRKEQAHLINERGIDKDGSLFAITASNDWKTIPPDACILIAVKYDGLKNVLPFFRNLPENQPLVFLQNGMLHIEEIKKLGQYNVAVGSVEHGVIKIDDRKIRHTGQGIYKFALIKGNETEFLPLLEQPGIRAEWHADSDKLLFRKVLLNTLINPLTALTGLKNGELVTNPYANELLEKLYGELLIAFPEMKNLLPFNEVVGLCNSTAKNTSSMLADKLAGKKMELDTIILYTLNRSHENLPLLRLLYLLLKSSEV